MSDATAVPQLQLFLWGTPSAPNPTLTSPLEDSATAQTATFSSAPLDSAGAKLTGDFLFAVRNKAGFTEVCYIPAAGMSADGLTATGVIRGINTGGGSIDYTATGGDDYRAEHEQGSAVFCPASSTHNNIIMDWIQGTGSMASGGTTLTLGDETDTDVTIEAALTSTVGFLRKDAGTGKAQYSNDGAAWVNIDSVSASNLIEVSAADTTPGYLDTKITVDADTMAKTITSPGGDERLELSASGGLADMIDDVTATATEVDQALSGISANVTQANLDTLTAGAASNADALHTHSDTAISFTAGESITEDDAVCLLPIEVEYFAQLTEGDLVLGQTNALRAYAIKITPSETTSTLTTMQFRAKESVNGATTLGDLDISIQGDNAGEPDGTPIANGSANAITQATQRTWNTTYGTRTATWAASPTLTAGTTYWIVFEVNGTDNTNYLRLGDNSTYDENYFTFTRLIYDLDAATWGNSSTTLTPFFWFNSQVKLLGMVVVPTDANFGGRTWGFVGFAESTVSAGASVNISTKLYDGLTGLEPGKDYYISATAGEVTDSPPTPTGSNGTMRYKIGRAYNTTNLAIRLGEKKTWATQNVSATTTYPIITWFRPNEVYCNNGTAGAGQYWGGQGTGYYNIGIDEYFSANSVTGEPFLYDCDRGDGAGTLNTGTGTATTDVGFTVSNTNSSGGNEIILTMIG